MPREIEDVRDAIFALEGMAFTANKNAVRYKIYAFN